MNAKIDEAILSLQEFIDAKEYWIKKLSGSQGVSLPYDFTLPKPDAAQKRYQTFVNQAVTEKLSEISKNNDLALFIVLLGALKVTLYKYSGQHDITVGAPVYLKGEWNHLQNKFVPLRDLVGDDMTFSELLNEVKQTVALGYKNQHYPAIKIMELMEASNDEAAAYFRIILSLENIHKKELINDIPSHFNNEMLFSMRRFDEGMEVNITFNSGRFKKDTIIKLMEHFTHILNQALTDTHIRLADFELVTGEEKEQILSRLSGDAALYPTQKTIHQLFEEQAEKNPHQTAIIFENRRLTYGEINTRANQLARYLKAEQSIKPEALVGILLEKSEDLIIAVLGVLKAGGAYVPLNPEYPEERIKVMINDAEIHSVISCRQYIGVLRRILGECRTLEAYLCIDSDDLSALEETGPNGLSEETFPGRADLHGEKHLLRHGISRVKKYHISPVPSEATPRNAAYVIYTSGTTGKPKGVVVEHRNVVRLFYHDKFQFDFNSDDIWTMFHSFSFDFSVWEMYGALLFGGKLVIIPKPVAQDPKEYLKILKKEKVTILNQTPTAFYNLAAEELEDNEQMLAVRYVIFGGEALKPAMLKGWREKYPAARLINMYGITETTVHVTYKEITEKEIESNISNIGKPIPTLTAYIMDRNLKLLPVGVPGELCVGGEGVARGYLKRPELTAAKFVMNPYRPGERLYRSGDLIRMLEDGEMEYLGRIDHQVKIRGHRIELGEIESHLLALPGMKEAVVVVGEDSGGTRSLCAYTISDPGFTGMELREYLSRQLPDYMIPAYFIALEKFPLTPNGKIDRQALPSPLNQVHTGDTYEAPRNDQEQKLVDIWREVLGIDGVGINENFFSLGGDSIKVISLISKINQALGTRIFMKDIYLHQTVKELASTLGHGPTGEFESDLEAGRKLLEEIKQNILADEKQASQLPEGWEDFYPLSQIQQGMVFYSGSKPEEPVYHDQFPYLMKLDRFDFNVFGQALRLMAQKHPILRTGFNMDHFSRPIQIVYKELKPDAGVFDIQHLDKEAQESYIQEYLRTDLQNRFIFENELLWRIRFFKLDREHYYLITTIHHAIMDGWSTASFNTELFTIYNKLIQGKEDQITKLKFSYKDYVALNLVRKSSEESRQYWKDTFAGYSRNKLPFNLSSKKISSGNRSRKCLKRLSGELLNSLEGQAKKNGCTVKEICLSAYVFLLKVITTEAEIVTGVVTHDRPAVEDSEKVLGCFLNTIPLRIRISGEISKLQLLELVKTYLLKSKPYELFLGDIANSIGLTDRTGNPFFDTLFNFTDFHVFKQIEAVNAAPDIDYHPGLNPNEMTNTLFDLEVTTTLHNFSLWIKYSENYFHPADIETAINLYLSLLEKYAASGDQPLTGAGLIPDQERKKLVFDFNRTTVQYPGLKTLNQLLEEQEARTPDRIALVYQGKTLTYRELNQKANRLARVLISQGVASGDYVGVITQRGFDMIAGMFAILKAGAAYVPVDPEYPRARREYLLKNSGVGAVITDNCDDYAETNLIRIDSLDVSQYSDVNLDLAKNSRDPAYVIYTSGSTGTPKGVMIEHHSAVNLIHWVNKEFRVGEKDSLLFITSMCFDLSVYDIFGILAAGGRVVIAAKEQVRDPEELKRLLKGEKITFWDSVPTTMNYLVNTLEAEGENYFQEDLRLVFMSGDWIPVKLPERIRRFFPNTRVISLGGATEGTVWSIYYPVEKVDPFQTSIPYGKPIDNNYFYILDPDLQIVPRGVAGELYIGGVGVARGYINKPELTAERFLPDPFAAPIGPSETPVMYKTGDLGRMLPDGNIEFLGRMDHQVKIRGFRVELGEIENHLLKHPAIQETVVVDRTDERGDKYLCAYIVSGAELEWGKLREYLARELPDYLIPSNFIRMERIPLTPNGKIDRRALPEPETTLDTGAAYEAPRNGIEEKMAEAWQEILGIKNPGINDNFFEIGGDSIKAMQVITYLKKKRLKLEIRDLLQQQTIKGMSVYVKPYVEKTGPAIVTGAFELIPTQKGFFRKTRTDINHWSLGIMFYKKDRFDEKIVEKVFRKIVEHHDALRIIFRFDGERITQYNRGLEGELFEFRIFDLVADQDDTTRMDEEVFALYASMDLRTGPLIKLALFKRADGDHLLMAIHHLLWDGLSMMILVEDFGTGYRQALKNEAIELPEKTSSLMDWSKQIQVYANSPALLDEIDYWEKMEQKEIHPLPKDAFASENRRKQDETMTVALLSEEETGLLLEDANRKYDTDVKDLLLTAFGASMKEWTGRNNILVDYKIHGREDIFEGIDVTRTVGWFGGEHPVVLEMPDLPDLSFHLKSIRDLFRGIPGRGLGYETLREITAPENKKRLKFSLNPEILFNYFGDFNINMIRLFEDFSMSPLSKPLNESPNSERKYTLIFELALAMNKLYLTVHYNKYEYYETTISRLVASFSDNLRKLIDLCLKQEADSR